MKTGDIVLSLIKKNSMQVGFVAEALNYYANYILRNEAEVREGLKSTPLIAPDAWITCAKEVKEAFK